MYTLNDIINCEVSVLVQSSLEIDIFNKMLDCNFVTDEFKIFPYYLYTNGDYDKSSKCEYITLNKLMLIEPNLIPLNMVSFYLDQDTVSNEIISFIMNKRAMGSKGLYNHHQFLDLKTFDLTDNIGNYIITDQNVLYNLFFNDIKQTNNVRNKSVLQKSKISKSRPEKTVCCSNRGGYESKRHENPWGSL